MIDSRDPEPRRRAVIDLNADMGEGFKNDRALLGLVTSASICCGAHAGSPASITQTLEDARSLGVVVGAHPGYPDREGFGRRNQTMSAHQVQTLISDQLRTITAFADLAVTRIAFLKPHGALYNQAQLHADIAQGVIAAAAESGLPLLGQPGTLLEILARDRGVRFIAEGFPDRRYRTDGTLVPRTAPDAILDDPALIAAAVVRLLYQPEVATLCIHGDDPRAVANAELVRRVLEQEQIAIRSFMDDRA
jgi:5-oxoprolinase (ATP-hydrolysing) subunit A